MPNPPPVPPPLPILKKPKIPPMTPSGFAELDRLLGASRPKRNIKLKAADAGPTFLNALFNTKAPVPTYKAGLGWTPSPELLEQLRKSQAPNKFGPLRWAHDKQDFEGVRQLADRALKRRIYAYNHNKQAYALTPGADSFRRTRTRVTIYARR